MATLELSQFYGLMHATIPVRRVLTEEILASRVPAPGGVARLRETLEALEAIPEEPAGRRLTLEEARPIHVDLGYEIEELKKDLVYLDRGEDALLEDLAGRHAGFREDVQAVAATLGGTVFQTLVTDRDGTVNNYCGRYASSVQSVYNAVFLTRFARARARRSVILTSAPLDNIGLADMTVSPPGAFICTGSKGREYLDPKGHRRQHPIDAAQQAKLDLLNRELDELLAQPGYNVFTLIGSGLQRKFGQTTIARQDIGGSVPEERSERFGEEVRQLVRSVDPDDTFFRIEDTGLDLEILLTVEDADGGAARDFDKGDGVRFLNADLQLRMDQGPCLICGDTASDVSMLQASLDLAPETKAVFVTGKDELRQRVRDLLPGAVFVDEPDALVAALNGTSRC
ncbi:MAG: trehalose 6-phosphate synthase [Acidobacteria bacterium]|nr:trehalose 6-phosphate synthase [Acidobacteriota bacterium]